MIRVQVIETFTLARFNELKNIKRAGVEEQGKLFVGDEFECGPDMVEYLTKTNKLGKAFVRVIEIIPEKEKLENAKEVKIELPKVKKTTKKKNSKKSC